MSDPSAAVRIDKAVVILGAAAREFGCQDRQALEAKARTAAAAKHFVALSALRCLAAEVLLCHSHATSRALLCTGLLHPSVQAASSVLFKALRVTLACQPLVEWLQAQRRQLSFLHSGQVNRAGSLASNATRIGHPGVGQGQRSAVAATACSRLRDSKRFSTSVETSFLRSRSAMLRAHSGHWTFTAPTSRRASTCRAMQVKQYQPWSHRRRVAPDGNTSSQQMEHTSGQPLNLRDSGLPLRLPLGDLSVSGKPFAASPADEQLPPEMTAYSRTAVADSAKGRPQLAFPPLSVFWAS
eukprot:CAMPEP_0170583158 /NCGR_PEP_ID=MMETSP0224-20130122/7978_1 /TAXON_ID=285029 /ORGANISM="Togula jolla, Strain CCCM 725" /LENGTH=296 /DNA_ID=CAMNT_0010906451 /DNA_START=147 /DNA_END=1039 /DNA_ORIENTATION=-